MKILYLIPFFIDKSDGVCKKILGQIEGIKNNGVDADLLEIKDNDIFLNQKNIGEIKMILKNDGVRLKSAVKKVNLINYDVVYLRISFSPLFYMLFSIIKKMEKKIIVEIPTYPYEGEIKLYNPKTWYLKIIIDKVLKKLFLRKYVDRVVTYSEDDYIYDVKCVNISNGISYLNNSTIFHKQNNKMNFISVSNLHDWHGVDRFILALQNYYENNGKEEILFHIVGTGKKLEKIKLLSSTKELKDRVIFYGRLEGQELDKVYEVINIAVGSLGRHRSGIEVMKALKNREYAAKGLPMIFSEIDLDFEGQDFVYKVKPDESIIDLFEIIEWYKNLKITSEEIREFSKQFSWNIQMKKVIDEINEI